MHLRMLKDVTELVFSFIFIYGYETVKMYVSEGISCLGLFLGK